MHTETRTPDQIERDIERERAGLADAVDALQEKFSPDAILREVAGGVRRHGGELGTAVTRSAKQNPMALAVTGIGLAWLIFGRSNDSDADQDRRNGHSEEPTEWRTASGAAASAYRPQPIRGDAYHPNGPARSYPPVAPVRHMPGNSARTYPAWARHDLDELADSGHNDDESSLGDRAVGVAKGAKSRTEDVSDSVRSNAEGAAESAKHAARGAADRAARMRDRLARGTEDLGEGARERVIAARSRAVEMAQRADTSARRTYARGREATADFVEDQPLVAGAIAIAVGAALAGALPRTRREDEALGEARDDLFDEAERIFEQEREKARNVVHAAANEAERIAREKRDAIDDTAPGDKSAAEAAADEVRDATTRVRNAAERKAQTEELGNPRS